MKTNFLYFNKLQLYRTYILWYAGLSLMKSLAVDIYAVWPLRCNLVNSTQHWQAQAKIKFLWMIWYYFISCHEVKNTVTFFTEGYVCVYVFNPFTNNGDTINILSYCHMPARHQALWVSKSDIKWMWHFHRRCNLDSSLILEIVEMNQIL